MKRRAPRSRARRLPKTETVGFGVRVDNGDPRDQLYTASLEDLPTRVDLRNKVGRIFDQRPEGACVGTAVCGAAELLYRIETGQSVRLSPRWVYRRAREKDPWPGENYAGTTPRAGLKAWHTFGICEERFWPFVPYSKRPDDAGFDLMAWEGQPQAGAAANARKFPLLEYRRCAGATDIKECIHRHGVVVVGAAIHTGWRLASGSDVIRFDSVQPLENHVFLVVGYDEVRRQFDVVNSWGTGWGAGGMARLSYDDAKVNFRDVWSVRIPG